MTTLVIEFEKTENDNATKYSMFYSNQKVKTVFNESDTDDLFESIYNTIISNIHDYVKNHLEMVRAGLLIQP